MAFTTRVSNLATNSTTSNHFLTFHLPLRHDPFMHFGCSMQRRIVVQSTILSDQHNTWAHRRSCMRFQLLPAGFMTQHLLIFFEDGRQNEIRYSWWIMFINSFSRSTFPVFWCTKVHPPGVGDSSTRRWARRRLRRLAVLEVLGATGAELADTESLG